MPHELTLNAMSFFGLFRSKSADDDPTFIKLTKNKKTQEILKMQSVHLDGQLARIAAGVRSPMDSYKAMILRELLDNLFVDGKKMLADEKLRDPSLEEDQFWNAFEFVRNNNAK